MAYEHKDLKIGSKCEYCLQYIEEDFDGDDDYEYYSNYRTLHCQGDYCTPHEPYYCSHCMFDDCLKDGYSVNNADPWVKEQYFTTSASLEEHTTEHENEDVNAGIYPARGMNYGDIEETDPLILKLLKHGTLTAKRNPRNRKSRYSL